MNNNLFNDLLESASDIVAIEREFNAVRQLFADMATVYDMGMISWEDYDQLRRNAVDAIVLRSRSKCVDSTGQP